MTRGFDASTLNALEADSAHPIIFVELGPFDTTSPETIEYLHSGFGTITWNSIDWVGIGQIMVLDTLKEGMGLSPQAIRLGVSAADADMIAIAMTTNYYRRGCKVYLGALASGALVADPTMIFSGYIEDIDVTMGGGEDQISITAESELIFFKRTRDVRYTANQLQSEYSGDEGFEYLESVAIQKVVWRGRDNPLGSGGSSRGSGGRSGPRADR